MASDANSAGGAQARANAANQVDAATGRSMSSPSSSSGYTSTSPTLTQQEVQNQVWAERQAEIVRSGNAALAASGASVSSTPSTVYSSSPNTEKVAVAVEGGGSATLFSGSNGQVYSTSPSFSAEGRELATPVGQTEGQSLKEATGVTAQVQSQQEQIAQQNQNYMYFVATPEIVTRYNEVNDGTGKIGFIGEEKPIPLEVGKTYSIPLDEYNASESSKYVVENKIMWSRLDAAKAFFGKSNAMSWMPTDFSKGASFLESVPKSEMYISGQGYSTPSGKGTIMDLGIGGGSPISRSSELEAAVRSAERGSAFNVLAEDVLAKPYVPILEGIPIVREVPKLAELTFLSAKYEPAAFVGGAVLGTAAFMAGGAVTKAIGLGSGLGELAVGSAFVGGSGLQEFERSGSVFRAVEVAGANALVMGGTIGVVKLAGVGLNAIPKPMELSRISIAPVEYQVKLGSMELGSGYGRSEVLYGYQTPIGDVPVYKVTNVINAPLTAKSGVLAVPRASGGTDVFVQGSLATTKESLFGSKTTISPIKSETFSRVLGEGEGRLNDLYLTRGKAVESFSKDLSVANPEFLDVVKSYSLGFEEGRSASVVSFGDSKLIGKIDGASVIEFTPKTKSGVDIRAGIVYDRASLEVRPSEVRPNTWIENAVASKRVGAERVVDVELINERVSVPKVNEPIIQHGGGSSEVGLKQVNVNSGLNVLEAKTGFEASVRNKFSVHQMSQGVGSQLFSEKLPSMGAGFGSVSKEVYVSKLDSSYSPLSSQKVSSSMGYSVGVGSGSSSMEKQLSRLNYKSQYASELGNVNRLVSSSLNLNRALSGQGSLQKSIGLNVNGLGSGYKQVVSSSFSEKEFDISKSGAGLGNSFVSGNNYLNVNNYANGFGQGFSGSVVVKVPTIVPLLRNDNWFGASKKPKKGKKGGLKSRYTSSLTAEVFNIRGNPLKGALSGGTIRPIPMGKSMKWRGSKIT